MPAVWQLKITLCVVRQLEYADVIAELIPSCNCDVGAIRREAPPQLLGAQIVGHWRSGVAKRIDVSATALYHGLSVDALNDLDLSYTPPLSSPWDPVHLAAQTWCRVAAAAESASTRERDH